MRGIDACRWVAEGGALWTAVGTVRGDDPDGTGLLEDRCVGGTSMGKLMDHADDEDVNGRIS